MRELVLKVIADLSAKNSGQRNMQQCVDELGRLVKALQDAENENDVEGYRIRLDQIAWRAKTWRDAANG